MSPTVKKYIVAAAVACVAGLASSIVEANDGDNIGDTQMCVRLTQIHETVVISDSTVLLKMSQKGGFKRVDMVAPCGGLAIAGGFGHSTSTEDLCTTDPLHVLEHGAGGGATCMIKQIVTISADEAKDLQHHKK